MTLFFQTLKAVVGATIVDFLYTPIWWYIGGLWKQLKWIVGSFDARQMDLAIDVWFKNLLVPMYGQYDFAGRLISFFMRLVQIVGRMMVLLVWGILLLAWLMAWLLIPVGVVYLIWIQI